MPIEWNVAKQQSRRKEKANASDLRSEGKRIPPQGADGEPANGVREAIGTVPASAERYPGEAREGFSGFAAMGTLALLAARTDLASRERIAEARIPLRE